jgi:hypothetical protein
MEGQPCERLLRPVPGRETSTSATIYATPIFLLQASQRAPQPHLRSCVIHQHAPTAPVAVPPSFSPPAAFTMRHPILYIHQQPLSSCNYPTSTSVLCPLCANSRLNTENLSTLPNSYLGPVGLPPPKSWKVNKLMGKVLNSLRSVHSLKVFVEVDPTHEIFC